MNREDEQAEKSENEAVPSQRRPLIETVIEHSPRLTEHPWLAK
jgi:hypothetical protein